MKAPTNIIWDMAKARGYGIHYAFYILHHLDTAGLI